MAVEIHILSGTRRGARVFLEAPEFRVGSEPDCEVAFDPRQDEALARRQLVFCRHDDGWYVTSEGPSGPMLNHTPIHGRHQLRSGDIVRLSQRGPDFAFTLVDQVPATARRTAPGEKPADLATAVPAVGEQNVPSPATSAAPAVDQTVGKMPRPVWLVLAAAVVAVVLLGVWASWRPGVIETAAGFRLEPVADQTVREDTALVLTVRRAGAEMDAAGSHPAALRFRLAGQPPSGATIDPATGQFRWQPNESQGPGRYPITVAATAADGGGPTDKVTFWITVQEVNSPPTVAPLAPAKIPAGSQVVLSARATDRDLPAGRLTFLLVDAPDWATIDAASGAIRCAPPAGTPSAAHRFSVRVVDTGQPPRSAETTVDVQVMGNPWQQVEQKLRDSVYLVTVGKPGSHGKHVWPFATCCGIGEQTLLCSAREVYQLAKWQRQGYRISVAKPDGDVTLSVNDYRVYRRFAELATTAGDWIYVNIGLLTTTTRLPHWTPLAKDNDSGDLEEGLPLACFGYCHAGDMLTRFDHLTPRLVKGKLYLTTRAEAISPQACLLEIKADLPKNMYGSPIVTRAGHIVGLYGEVRPNSGNAGPKNIHFATTIDTARIEKWLHEKDPHGWVDPLETDVSKSAASPRGGKPAPVASEH